MVNESFVLLHCRWLLHNSISNIMRQRTKQAKNKPLITAYHTPYGIKIFKAEKSVELFSITTFVCLNALFLSCVWGINSLVDYSTNWKKNFLISD